MKKIITGLLLLTALVQAQGQTFKKRLVTVLAEPLTNIQAEWVSMNADTLMDLVLAGGGSDGEMKIVTFQNLNTAAHFEHRITQATGMKAGHLQVLDWNRDGKMDVLISAKTLIDTDAIFAFNGMGDFRFTKQTQKLLAHSGSFLVTDLDSDALPDVITVGTQLIQAYQNTGTGLIKKFELSDIAPAGISAFDMNRDGMMDFVVSGHDQLNRPVTSLFLGDASFGFARSDADSPIEGALSLADINDDGGFDVIVAGPAETNIYLNLTQGPVKDSTFTGLAGARLFSGDMTSDGKTDLLLSGKRVNDIHELGNITTHLDTTGLIVQRMGDKDRDGDLDLVQIIDSIGSQWLKYYENTSPAVNKRPNVPGTGLAVSTFNRTFIFWDPATDDHTATPSVTYDVSLSDGQHQIIAPSFDLSHGRRSVVRHGNAGTATAMMVRELTDNRYYYWIQAVDNAYNGSVSFCSGGVVPCFDLTHEDVQACKGDEVKLAGADNSVWYSLSAGFLGETDTLSLVATASDTLFSFSPQQQDCSKNKVFVVHVNEGPPSEKQTIYSCKGKTIQLAIEPGWSDIHWDTSPAKSNVATIDYLVNGADTVTATARSQGCTYRKQFFIKISEPVVSIEGDGFQVLKGHSVQLIATGNAATWQWDPPEGLSDSTIPDPLATPSVSTEYIVTGTDSVGCSASARTTVLVQETAFVPNLFTPNGDGKNDNLMIYGLTSAARFNFKIYNREGSLVYETKDIAQASTSGWNGFVQGTRQPSGIYYWKVDGETPDGHKLLLNGKTTGSILLVH